MLKELLFLFPLCSATFSLCAHDLDHVSITDADLQKLITFYHISIIVSSIDKVYKKLKNANVEYVSYSQQTIPAYVKGKCRSSKWTPN